MTTKTDQIPLAVIGMGWIGQRHARAVIASPHAQLVGCCDSDRETLANAGQFHVPRYDDLSELIQAERPAGVIIATPNDHHRLAVEICAAFGVHTLIEKPVAGSISAGQRIVAVAEDAAIKTLVGHHRRHSRFVRRAREQIQSGALGRLLGVSMLWTLLKPDDYFEVPWRTQRPGGGPTMINLIHELDTLRFVCGEIESVFAFGSQRARQLDVEDTLSISLRFADGTVGTILASDATPAPWSYELTTKENPDYPNQPTDCYFLIGTEGSLSVPRMEQWQYPDGPRGWHQRLHQTVTPVKPTDPLAAQLDHFVRVVRGEADPIVDARDALRTLQVASAIIESMETGQPVAISPGEA